MKWKIISKIDESKIRENTFVFSFIVLFISLTQDCFCTRSHCLESSMVFAFGFLGVYGGSLSVLCWLANPLLIFSWIFIKKTKVSLILSILSTLIALSFYFFINSVVINEAGTLTSIMSYEIGYWLWLTSIIIMLFGNVLLYIKISIKCTKGIDFKA